MSRPPLALVCAVAMTVTPLCSRAVDRIVIDSLAPTQARLYIANADGAGERALTQPGSLNYNPSWSPTGEWIVFTSERTGPAELFRIHPDGSGLEQLTDVPAYNDQAAFSPDAKRVVFVSTRAAGRANLWTLDIATRKATRLTAGDGGDFRPAWSPDGKWIAFSSDRGSDLPPAKGRWERLQLVDLYLIHPDGTGLRRITQHGGFCGSPKWTADSNDVVAYCVSAQDTWTFRSGDEDGHDQLVKFDIATGASTPIAAGPGVKLEPSILPSGQIAYVRSDKSAQGIFYAMGTPGSKGGLFSPSWSPDGRHVVYWRRSRTIGLEPAKQWSRNKSFEIFSADLMPNYDPTGEHLAEADFVPDKKTGAFRSILAIVDKGKAPRTVLARAGLILAPNWSPDGKQIVAGVGAFSSFLDFEVGDKKPVDPVNGGAQVAVLNADGSGFHLITSGPNNNAFAAFAPDGKHIVYRTQGPDGNGLRIMNLEDHSVRVLTNDYDNFPVWSPRGGLIAFMRQIDGFFEVMTIDPDGTDLKQLTYTRGNEAHIAWSPDGQRILFTSSRMGFKDEVLLTPDPQPYGEIFVMRYDGTQVEQLTDDQWEEGAPAWRPSVPSPSAAGAPRHGSARVDLNLTEAAR